MRQQSLHLVSMSSTCRTLGSGQGVGRVEGQRGNLSGLGGHSVTWAGVSKGGATQGSSEAEGDIPAHGSWGWRGTLSCPPFPLRLSSAQLPWHPHCGGWCLLASTCVAPEL